MNNTCPACGAIYNVAAKDVGRRIRCKKCSTALLVTDAGLEVEDPTAGGAPPPMPAPRSAPAADDFDDEVEPAPRRGRDRRAAGPGLNPGELLTRVGGLTTVATILFGLGVFLVVFTGFQEAIGKAKVERRKAAIDAADLRYNADIKSVDENKELSEDKKAERKKKLTEEHDKERKTLEEDERDANTANRRSGYWDKYTLMFGFLLIAFGCIGYLMADSALLLRVVAAIILVSMVLALFKGAVGAGAGIGAGVSIG